MTGWLDMFAPRVLMESVNPDMTVEDFAEDLISFEYVNATRQMDKCTLTIANKNLKYANDPRLDREIRLRVKWGYPSGLSDTRTIVVVQISPNLSMGVPQLVMTAYDTGQNLVRTGARNWGPVASSVIARRIAERHGLTADVVDVRDARREYRTQTADTTDYEFLARLADRVNYDFWIENSTLHYRPIDTGRMPAHRFTYFIDGGSILKSFHPTVKKGKIHRRNHAGTTAAGEPAQSAPRRNQRALGSHRVQIINTRTGTLGGVRTIGNDAETAHTTPSPETSNAVREAHASSEQTAAEMGSVNMTAELVGYPGVRARDVIEVNVIERRYSGLWRVEEVRESVASGYETQLRLKRAEINANGTPSATSAAEAARVARNERNSASGTQLRVPMYGIDTRRVIAVPNMEIVRSRPTGAR